MSNKRSNRNNKSVLKALREKRASGGRLALRRGNMVYNTLTGQMESADTNTAATAERRNINTSNSPTETYDGTDAGSVDIAQKETVSRNRAGTTVSTTKSAPTAKIKAGKTFNPTNVIVDEIDKEGTKLGTAQQIGTQTAAKAGTVSGLQKFGKEFTDQLNKDLTDSGAFQAGDKSRIIENRDGTFRRIYKGRRNDQKNYTREELLDKLGQGKFGLDKSKYSGMGVAGGTTTEADMPDDVTAETYTGKEVTALTDATAASLKDLTKSASATDATLTKEAAAATRDTEAETKAKADDISATFVADTKSKIGKVTGEQATVGDTTAATEKERTAITGEAADDGTAAKIVETVGYDAAQRRTVKGTAAKGAAAEMLAIVGELPPNITAAIVEDPATMTAALDEQPVEVRAAIAALPTEALVSSQMEGLLAGMDEGVTPAWARPALANVEQMLAQRGLSASTVGRDALFNAIITTAMPMAQSNAQALQQRAAQNLGNQQQANLQQSTLDMQRRMANLSNQQQASSQSATMAQQMNMMQSQFKQDAVMTSAQMQQQTRTQNIQNQQQAAVLNAQQQQATNAQNLGNEQQVELANLQIQDSTARENMTSVNQERMVEMQVAADFLAKNAGFKQQMDLANLSNEQQMSLANLTAKNQASSENLSAKQQTQLANLNSRLQTNLLQGKIAAEMNVAQLSVDQQTAVKNAATVANLDLTKFNAKQQVELTNSKFMQTMVQTEFNAEQQAIMQNATAQAGLDSQNADARNKASIVNAQNFLKMDMANLNNKQQAVILDQQMKQQRVLSTQASINAAKQFNATSMNQTRQFQASLASNMDQFNASQANAMAQFNESETNKASAIDAGNQLKADQINADLGTKVAMFDQELQFRTDSWNASNLQAVEQSNVEWRRKSNTINTAATNAANQQNAQYAFNMSTQAQSQLWQELRDQSTFDFQASQSGKDRALNLMNAALGSDKFLTDSSLSFNRNKIFGVIQNILNEV